MEQKNMQNTPHETVINFTTLPEYTPERIRALMKRLELSEKGLALVLNVQPMTVRLWTNGVSAPCSAARRMLHLLEIAPQIIDIIGNKGDLSNE